MNYKKPYSGDNSMGPFGSMGDQDPQGIAIPLIAPIDMPGDLDGMYVPECVDICGVTIRLDSIESVAMLDDSSFIKCPLCDKLRDLQMQIAEKFKPHWSSVSWIALHMKDGRTIWLPDSDFSLYEFLSWALIQMPLGVDYNEDEGQMFADSEEDDVGEYGWDYFESSDEYDEEDNIADKLYFSFASECIECTEETGHSMDQTVRTFYVLQDQIFSSLQTAERQGE